MREFKVFMIGGDFNQDPPPESTGGNRKRRKKLHDPLSNTLLKPNSPATDVFRACGMVRPTRKGSTRRIDYVLVNKEHLQEQFEMWRWALDAVRLFMFYVIKYIHSEHDWYTYFDRLLFC